MGEKWVSVSQLYGEICRRYELKRAEDYTLPRPGFRRVDRVFSFVSDFPAARQPREVPDEALENWVQRAVDRLVEDCRGEKPEAEAGDEPGARADSGG
jgi:hypothetical protein